jgi:hypothetical protein
MKRRIPLAVLFACVIAALILLFLHRPLAPSKSPEIGQTPTSTQSGSQTVSQSNAMQTSPLNEATDVAAQIEHSKAELTNMNQLWRTPLLYYGKVVDESNQPIAGVRVSYAGNSADESLTKATRNQGSVTTDDRGIFKIDGLYGIGLMFQLYHPNYYPYPDNSTGFDVRSPPRDGIVENSEANSRIFRMHSKGHPVSLVHRVDGMNVPFDGTPTALNLKGSSDAQIIGKLIVEASGNPPARYNQQPFDYDVKVSVPDGGLVEYTNYFDFVAPESGYQSSVEFSFPKDTNGWTDTISENYFVHLPSGYARLNIYMGVKRPLFFSIAYDYNPDGSPNLERATGTQTTQ